MLKITDRLIIIALVLSTIIIFTTSARGCPKRGRDTKIGSSIPEWSLPAPSSLTATAFSYSEIRLSWQDNSNNEEGFAIERKEWAEGVYTQIGTLGASETSYSNFASFYPATIYYYRVYAFNMIGDRSNYSNEASATTSEPVWISITAGGNHSLALTSNGTIWSWGYNYNGQLGVGDINTRFVPTPLGTDTDWSKITCGGYHSLALKTNGLLWSWGANGLGQLGTGDTIYENWIPFPVNIDSDWAEIAAGLGHSLSRKIDKTLWSWGDNGFTQLGLGNYTPRLSPTQVGTDSDWSLITAGSERSIFIKTNGSAQPPGGTIWGCGNNQSGLLGLGYANQNVAWTPTQIGTDSDWFTVASWGPYSNGTTLAIKSGGTLWAWGINNNGQLGLGDINNRNTPSPVGTDSDWSLVTVGMYHTISLKINGTLWSWGLNDSNQLGLGDTTNRITPTQIGSASDWSIVTAGDNYTIALKTNNTIWAWGENDNGQLGLGDNTNRSIPTQILLGLPNPPSSLATIVVSSSQIDLSWTDNSYNEAGFKIELRIGRTGTWEEIKTVGSDITSYSDSDSFYPDVTYYYRVRAYNPLGYSLYSNEAWASLSGNWLSVAAGGGNHSIALKANGTIWAWGYNQSGQLGLGNSGIGTERTTPTQVGTASDWSIIAAGGGKTGPAGAPILGHSIGIKTNLTIWLWGDNRYGQLGIGIGDTNSRNSPAQAGTDSDWAGVTAGISHTVSIKTNSTIWAWGYNWYGQLGLGDTNNRTTPTLIDTDSDWSIIAAGKYHTLSLKTNSTVWAWGYNEFGQLGLGDASNRTTPSQIGSDSDWATVSAGYDHTIARKTNNTIWAWGNNANGQLGLGDSGTGTNRLTPTQIGQASDWSIIVAAGGRIDNPIRDYTIALKTNGTLWAWGSNFWGQLGLGGINNIDMNIPTQVQTDRDWSKITAGTMHAIAIKRDGTIWVWGRNNYGQLGLGDFTNRNVPTLVGE